MIPVNRFMPDALASVLRHAPLTHEKVCFAWRTAVGASVDRATTVSLDGTTLRVIARDPQWRREIEHSAGLIRARLDLLLDGSPPNG